jgi:hypothetical protein
VKTWFWFVVVLVSGVSLADETATIRWTAPTTTQDGTPLTGRYQLTEYQVFINGVATSVPRSVTQLPVTVASGQTIEVFIKACHARRCSAPSNTIRFTASRDSSTDTLRAPGPPDDPVIDAGIGQSVIGQGRLIWSGTGAGDELADFGRIVGRSDSSEAYVVTLKFKRARQGELLTLSPFSLSIVNGRVRAQWQERDRPESLIVLTHNATVQPNAAHRVVFACDARSDIWTLTVDGSTVHQSGAARCLGQTSGRLRVGGAGGNALVEIHAD